MAPLVAAKRAGLLVMAHEQTRRQGGPMARVIAALGESLEIARAAGIPEESIVIDPGIGFFRRALPPGFTWDQWDCAVLRELATLRSLGRPICVGASRKSFIGAVSRDEDAANRLFGSLAAHAIAVLHGAHLIRTHDVRESAQAVRVAESIRGNRG